MKKIRSTRHKVIVKYSDSLVIEQELVILRLGALSLALYVRGVDADQARHAGLEPAARPDLWECAASTCN